MVLSALQCLAALRHGPRVKSTTVDDPAMSNLHQPNRIHGIPPVRGGLAGGRFPNAASGVTKIGPSAVVARRDVEGATIVQGKGEFDASGWQRRSQGGQA